MVYVLDLLERKGKVKGLKTSEIFRQALAEGTELVKNTRLPLSGVGETKYSFRLQREDLQAARELGVPVSGIVEIGLIQMLVEEADDSQSDKIG